MITLQRVGDSITGAVNGKRFGVSFNPDIFNEMVRLQADANSAVSTDALKLIIEDFEKLTVQDYKTKVMTACPDLYVSPGTGKYYLKYGHTFSSIAMPDMYAKRILESVEKNIDVQPLIKAWIRFLRNPNFTETKATYFAAYILRTYVDYSYANELQNNVGLSNEVAIERATVTQTPITQEGLLCTYKVSKELTEKYVLDENGNSKTVSRYSKKIDENTGIITYDTPEFAEDFIFQPAVMGSRGDEFSCDLTESSDRTYGHVIKVGHVHSLEDWSKVNTNDNQSCTPGLHVGNLDYIRGYQNLGTVTHNVFVDPMHIGAFTNDGTGALRVLSYFVHSTFDKVNRSIYHSSKYAEVTDAQWEIWKQEAVERYYDTDDADDTFEEIHEL